MTTSKRENEGAGNPAAEKKARTAAAASGAAAKAQPAAQPDNSSKFDVLMIPPQQPFRPKMPSQEDIVSGRAVSVRSYAENLHRYIVWEFSMFLYDDEVVQLRHPLYASRCPRIEEERPGPAASGAVPGKKPANAAAWRPTSIMEPMDIEHCIMALTESRFGIWTHS